MARAAASSRRAGVRAGRRSDTGVPRVGAELVGVGLLGISLLTILALLTFDPADPLFELKPVANWAGVFGASLAGWLFAATGYGAYVLVGALTWLGGRLCAGRGLPRPGARFWLGSVLLFASISTLPALVHDFAPGQLGPVRGGALGDFLAEPEELLLSRAGALLVNGLFLVLGALSVTGISTGSILSALGRAISLCARGSIRAIVGSARGAGRSCVALAEWIAAGFALLKRAVIGIRVWRERRARRTRVAAIRAPAVVGEDGVEHIHERRAAGEGGRLSRSRSGSEPHIVDHAAERRAEHEPTQASFGFESGAARGPFVRPDISVFQQPPEASHSYDRESLLMNSRILEKKLQDFGVRGHVVRVHPGPVITMYEYEPASGVKVNKIVNLSDDLAMALRALSVRIIAPLPGKSVVGIEVPNAERETVYLRSLLEAAEARSGSSKLSIAMGKDIFGNCVDADLSRMPHLLVAGATGTGKSVFLNSLLCSLLYRLTPEDLKLLLIDPKLLELSVYEGIPHLIADVVTNPKRAAAALAGVVRKMEERYNMMSALQVRNIDQFNDRVDAALAKGDTTFHLRPKPGEEIGEEIEYRRLPYIVVVIDELADLMVLAAKDVEESLQRLAQMARAAGIHLVLATQRPSVDVLTGIIKANFPARVSFQVSSRTDSRTILDQNGADTLLGEGDLLFLPPGTSRLQRLHGAYVSEKEVGELVAFLRDQGQPEFDDSLIRLGEESAERRARDEEIDEMFDRAVAIVVETRNASISFIQRRLRIGYNRAARIVEQMEADGMVGPQDGTKPRDVFLRSSDVDE